MIHSLYSCRVTDTKPLLSDRNLIRNSLAGFEIFRIFSLTRQFVCYVLLSTERETVCYRATDMIPWI